MQKVSEIIVQQFDVVEKVDRSGFDSDRLGYRSIHYLVRLSEARLSLPEYARFAGLVGEIQVRTILQHAWAEIEHDIQYKTVVSLPTAVRRRFQALAGLIEIADREFQAIQDEDRALRHRARKLVQSGNLQEVEEITPDALKSYLNKKFGADRRVSQWSYLWASGLVTGYGFKDLQELDELLALYDDDRVSKAAHGSRQGQVTRLEDVLLAAMGSLYMDIHPFNRPSDVNGWSWQHHWKMQRERMAHAGVELREYRPSRYPDPPRRIRPFGQGNEGAGATPPENE